MTHTQKVIAHRQAVNMERKYHMNLVLIFATGVLLFSWAAVWLHAVTDDSALHVPAHPTYLQVRHASLEGLLAR